MAGPGVYLLRGIWVTARRPVGVGAVRIRSEAARQGLTRVTHQGQMLTLRVMKVNSVKKKMGR